MLEICLEGEWYQEKVTALTATGAVRLTFDDDETTTLYRLEDEDYRWIR
jgi:hypothetical protein